MGIEQDFKVYCSTNFKDLNKSLIEDAFKEDNELILKGIASTTNIDEEGDYMTKACLEDMKRQAIGLSVLNGHGRTLDDILGKVIGIPPSDDDTFEIEFKILPKHKYYLLDFMENDINLGLSIGAKALEYEPNEDVDYGWKVNKARLYEISLVPLPANWDSFGSVKISKELDDEGIIAKCFNGACKQVVKEYSEMDLKKEVEDAQKEDEEKYLTKKEALNYINEASLGIYERVLSEVLDEAKKMIEKYHLDTNSDNSQKETNKSENSNDKNDDNSSKNKEDEEKNKSMSEEIDKKVETDETPNFQKNLDENEASEEKLEVNKEMNEEKLEAKDTSVEVTVGVEEVSNKDVLKSIKELESSILKGIDEKIEAKIEAKINDKLSEEKYEEMKKSIRKEMEEDLLKDLSTERKPVETKQPKVEKELEESEEEEEEVKKAMNSYDIAKMLCG